MATSKKVDYRQLHQAQSWQLYEFYIAKFEQDHAQDLSDLIVEDQGRGTVVYRDLQGQIRAEFNYFDLVGEIR
jgi:hypothetical protein